MKKLHKYSLMVLSLYASIWLISNLFSTSAHAEETSSTQSSFVQVSEDKEKNLSLFDIEAKEGDFPLLNIQEDLLPSCIDEKEEYISQVYPFTHPSLAYEILTQLDIPKEAPTKYTFSKLGLQHSQDYCQENRAYFTEHPESIFQQINFLTSALSTSLLRNRVLKMLGNDVHPEVGYDLPVINETIPMKPEINLFFTKNSLYGNLTIGHHFSCLSQVSNHIPGHQSLGNKGKVAMSTKAYKKLYVNRTSCFDGAKFFPKTWVLDDPRECTDFFKRLNYKQYRQLKQERTIVYVSKSTRGDSQGGQGVTPLDEQEEKYLVKSYNYGLKCTEKRNMIVQTFIHNPLLLNGYKFDFRMYMLIASTNPLIAFYHDGFLRVSLLPYDINSDDINALLTSLALNERIYEKARKGTLHEGMDEQQLKLASQWSLERLQDYLLEKNIVTDPNWLDNYLRPEFKKAMIHLLRMSSSSFKKDSSLYELYGVDFLLDEELNLWFIEANSSPALDGYSIPMEKFIAKMLRDHIKVVIGLMRSRMKRVVDYVNKLSEMEEIKVMDDGQVIIQDLQEKRKEFNEITRNYFEKEFMPDSDNGFSLILDENLEGIERYQGFIEESCLE